MCTHGRFVTNRYTHQEFWCKCGHCKSCLQEKAASRSSRIRAEYDGKSSVYFLTLTYDRMSVPYFYESDLINIRKRGFGTLNVYRDHSIKWSVNKQKYIKKYEKVILKQLPLTNQYVSDEMAYTFRHLTKQPGKVGVCYFPDVQNFEKRFRERLRRAGFTQRLKFFNVTEYGGRTLRPHAHILLWSPSGNDQILHEAFIASWPFGRRVRAQESFQLVKDDPAGYVSSYVNGGDNLCEFLTRNFKSKHSASKLFGHGRSCFTFPAVKEKIESGCLNYTLSRIVQGVPAVIDLPIPKYVINRWFPLVKGYSRLASSQIYDYISTGLRNNRLYAASREYDVNHVKTQINYTNEDLHKIQIRLFNAYQNSRKYFDETDKDFTFSDYAILYEKAWRVYKSTCYKYFVLDDSVNDFYKYDNICLLSPLKQSLLHKELSDGKCQFIVDNNKKPHYVNRTIKMTSMYDKYCKQKDVTNYVLCEHGIDF